jgi:hypothetical protein
VSKPMKRFKKIIKQTFSKFQKIRLLILNPILEKPKRDVTQLMKRYKIKKRDYKTKLLIFRLKVTLNLISFFSLGPETAK